MSKEQLNAYLKSTISYLTVIIGLENEKICIYISDVVFNLNREINNSITKNGQYTSFMFNNIPRLGQ